MADMAFNNPIVPWREIERALSDRPRDGRRRELPPGANGGDSPAWSYHRPVYEPPAIQRPAGATPYAELHCHTSFSFLDGASPPEELVEEAARLGLSALAVTDHDGFYGVVRFAEAARVIGMPTIFGAELSLGLGKPQNGVPDPEGSHLLVLARDPRATPTSPGPSASASWPGRRRASLATRRPTAPSGPSSTRGAGWCSPAVARARSPRRC